RRLQTLLNSEAPVSGYPRADDDSPRTPGIEYDVRASLAMAIYPIKGKPWAFGLHQCDGDRKWTEAERELFKEIGHRISEVLSSLLLLKDLHESEHKYKTLTNNLTIGVYRTTPAPEGKIIEANPAIAALFGHESREDFLGTGISDLFEDPGEIEKFDEKFSEEGAIQYENIHFRKKSGESFIGSVSAVAVKDEKGEVTYYDGMIEDVTGRKNLEDQLRQVQKMEAMGALAGGIAHDFNNILFPIVGFVEMMLEDISESSPHYSPLSQVLNAATRARELVKQILSFSRQSEAELKPLKAQIILKEVLKLVRSTLPTTIEIRRKIDEKCGPIKADPSHIHQIAMNLITNAFHAMQEAGGVLEIGLAEVHLDPGVLGDPEIESGAFARIKVADTGDGMPAHVISRIFEPYFTTKEKGKGTGLGLSVVNGIVKSYGGCIQVESQPGEGTVFRVYLPVVDSEVKTRIKTRGPVPRGSERVMLVDDEDPIIRMEQRLLTRLGYQVSSFTSSPEALEAFKANPDQYDLIITDMTMPTITGDRLSKEVIKIKPDMPIIMCTGFSELITEKSAMEMGIREFVLKPIVIREIAESIRKALGPGKGEALNPLPPPPKAPPPRVEAPPRRMKPRRMKTRKTDDSNTRVLLVDDEEPIRNSLGWFLEDFDFDVTSVGSAEEALGL
ncbi:MAG: response regulator, partial [Desulfobacterales bacterium]|nr:response regulator [Desulfobacterales bacterium]